MKEREIEKQRERKIEREKEREERERDIFPAFSQCVKLPFIGSKTNTRVNWLGK